MSADDPIRFEPARPSDAPAETRRIRDAEDLSRLISIAHDLEGRGRQAMLAAGVDVARLIDSARAFRDSMEGRRA